MKIAFISTMEGSPWGGSEYLWSQSAERLVKEGHTVVACVKKWPQVPQEIERLSALGASVYQRPSLNIPRRIARRLGWSHAYPFDWLREFKPDLAVISMGSPFEMVATSNVCRNLNLRYTLIIHLATDWSWPNDSERPKLVEAYQRADAVYFVSRATQAMVERQLALRLPDARIVRNPFNICYNSDPPWPETDGQINLACVSRLDPAQKGHDLLFQLLCERKWRDRNLRVRLFGSGPYEQVLRALATDYSLTNVQFCGHVDRIEDIWANHHALILPSRAEGLPLAIVEAMLCGRPCIATAVGGNAEMIDDNETGFLAAAPTVASLDEAMDRAWSRCNEWPTIGRLAAHRVRQRVPADPIGAFIDNLKCLMNDDG